MKPTETYVFHDSSPVPIIQVPRGVALRDVKRVIVNSGRFARMARILFPCASVEVKP